jgi:hypothetical protein
MASKSILFTSNFKILPHMPSNNIKCKGSLGKIIPVALKYLIYAMHNSPSGTPQAHGSDLAPVKYPTGVTDSSCKYFSWHALGGGV